MGLVHEQERPVLFLQRHDFRERSEVTVHAENRLRHHDDAAIASDLPGGPLEMALEPLEVVVGKDPHCRSAQSGPVNERGVAEFVEDEDVAFSTKGRQGPRRGGEARTEAQPRFGAL